MFIIVVFNLSAMTMTQDTLLNPDCCLHHPQSGSISSGMYALN